MKTTLNIKDFHELEDLNTPITIRGDYIAVAIRGGDISQFPWPGRIIRITKRCLVKDSKETWSQLWPGAFLVFVFGFSESEIRLKWPKATKLIAEFITANNVVIELLPTMKYFEIKWTGSSRYDPALDSSYTSLWSDESIEAAIRNWSGWYPSKNMLRIIELTEQEYRQKQNEMDAH